MTDNGSPPLSDNKTVTIHVTEPASGPTLITNGVDPGTVGYFAFEANDGGYSDQAPITAKGTTQTLTNQDVLFDFINFVAVGGSSTGTDLAGTTITRPVTRLDAGTAVSEGTFQGPNGPISWACHHSLDAGSRTLVNTVEFTSTSAFGDVRYTNYLDEDVLDLSDNVLFVNGAVPAHRITRPNHPGPAAAGRIQPGRCLRPSRSAPGQRDLARLGRRPVQRAQERASQ